jgi:hydroxyacylglutathione hydrolase
MKIERFEVPGLAQYSYIVSANGRAVVIDPVRDVERYMEYVSSKGLILTHILESHIHADFAAGSTALAEATGAELALSSYDQGELYRYAMPHRSLRDGDCIEVGSVRLQVLHTPGHTPEHLSFLLFDTERSKSVPMALFSGDFLFVGSLGRPDLLGEAAKQGLAHELFRSLHERIAALPDGVAIYPGHGAGSLCGSGMSERAESTLGYERATNPLFALDEASFVREILASVPPMPTYYPRMKQLNASGASSVSNVPGGRALSIGEVAGLAENGDVILLDLRRAEAFGGAHIRGAINIGAGQNLSLWSGWLLDSKLRIVLVGNSGDQEASRRALVRVGLDRIEGYLDGGMTAWIDSGRDFVGTLQISVRQVSQCAADALVLDVLVLDVRSETEWSTGHIAGAMHIMLGDLGQQWNTLPSGRSIVTVCGSGYRSSIAASLLQQRGIPDVSSMAGGMGAWQRQQLPVVCA